MVWVFRVLRWVGVYRLARRGYRYLMRPPAHPAITAKGTSADEAVRKATEKAARKAADKAARTGNRRAA